MDVVGLNECGQYAEKTNDDAYEKLSYQGIEDQVLYRREIKRSYVRKKK